VAEGDDTQRRAALEGPGANLEDRREPPGLVRDRLTARLADPGSYLVGWVVAPAGSGKSRLLAQLADTYPGPVAWCGTPDPVPRTEQALVTWLWRAIEAVDPGHTAAASGGLPPDGGTGDGAASGARQGAPPGDAPQSVDALVRVLGGSGQPILVVIDDAHLLEGSEAESALAELISRELVGARLVIASRVNLGADLSRLRVSGRLVEIGPDDLRFRTWEVEALFRDVYGEPLLPEDVADLARRTGGWAAYLQLFFLATARKPQSQRRQVLGSLDRRFRLISEYLGRHVLAGLSAELQDFLIRTSVLRRPSGALCDEFLGRSGSHDLLAELERRRLFTERIDDDAFRYHTVLLAYLDAQLAETIGADAARGEHHRAGLILEREGATEDALAAFAKAQDWDGVARLLGDSGRPAARTGDAWIEALPPAVIETDSMLLLVRAHGALARGSLADAAQILREAENVAASSAVAKRCRSDREHVLSWLEPGGFVSDDWIGTARKATQRQPLDAYRQAAALPGPTGRFAEGIAAFMAGDVRNTTRIMRAVSLHPDAAPALAGGARLLAAFSATLTGRGPNSHDVERLVEEIEAAAVPWLDRIARAAFLTGLTSEDALDDLVASCERDGDRWGAALVAGICGVGMMREGRRAVEMSERAGRAFSDLGAGVPESTVLGFGAIAALKSGDLEVAGRLAQKTRTLAGVLDAPWGMGLAALVVGTVFDDERELAWSRRVLQPLGSWEWHAELAGLSTGGPAAVLLEGDSGPIRIQPAGERAAMSNGAVSNGPSGTRPISGDPGPIRVQAADLSTFAAGSALPGTEAAKVDRPGVRLKCLGGFALSINGHPVDDSSAKPMERSLLHLLAMKADEPVHREALIEALWPDAELDAGRHRLQVAVSSLRRLLGGVDAEGAGLLARDGDSYRLALPGGSNVDILEVERAVQAATRARTTGDAGAEEEALAGALVAYGGPLLPGDGPANWVVERRSSLSGLASDAAARLATLHLQSDHPQAAAETARAGLAVDRYRDELWKLLIDAAERAGNHAEAERARRGYEAVLDELGV
jgi:DNA-binding SARP family transcriptional activator